MKNRDIGLVSRQTMMTMCAIIAAAAVIGALACAFYKNVKLETFGNNGSNGSNGSNTSFGFNGSGPSAPIVCSAGGSKIPCTAFSAA